MSQGIILLGIKHCGKSTLGQMLANQFNCPFFDTDDVIAEMTGKTPREIYQQQGAEAFMEAEARACDYLSRYLASLGEDEYIIATGGGICTNQQALDSLQRLGFFLFLEVPEEVAAQRILDEIEWEDGTMKNLPAYIASENPTSTEDVERIFSGFYKERTTRYRKLAQITCNLKGETPEENCQLLREALFSQDCRWD
ncbi:MAG: shikimate kinase [Spirochaetaceae bacterium]|nr:shikimate kinase [Spirochaetaceae bacterium]